MWASPKSLEKQFFFKNMFASLVNYYKVSEIEKSSSNNENIRQISSSDILSPKTVASLRRQPLQEISIDLLKKQQVFH